jgi:hypothetical protein
MCSNGAQRQRRHRERTRAGLIVLQIEADEVALTEQLVIAGFLAPQDVEDRDAITAALERVVALWAQGVTRNATPFSDLP